MAGYANPGNGGMKMDYGKGAGKPDAGLDLGPKHSGEVDKSADEISSYAQECAKGEGFHDPNAEDPTSRGAGGEPLGNKK